MDMVKFCRFCFNIIYDDDFSTAEMQVSEMLKDLFMNVNLEITGDPVMCKKCTTDLQHFSDFKRKCLSAENMVKPFKDTNKNSTMDLNETCLKENKDLDINSILEDKKICRFCMKCINYDFTQLYDTKKNIYILSMLQKHIPELNWNVAEELIACKSCFDSLQSFHGFITKCIIYECIDVEDKITEYAESEGNYVNGHIQLNERVKEGSNCIKVKTENLLEDDEYMSIKTEEIDFKMELTDDDSQDTTTSPQCDIPMYKCPKCSFTTKYRWNLSLHDQTHQSPSELTMYKCDICLYKTRLKSNMKRHLLKHKKPSELKLFSCRPCTCKDKCQNKLKCHRVHHQTTKIKLYKCNVCSYTAIRKARLNEHVLVHKSPSEVTMYKCTECTFETKYKRSLQKHINDHKCPSNVFQCDSCPYRSGNIGDFIQHVSHHIRAP